MTEQQKKKMRLDSLHARHTGLTAALGATFDEAASVCFDRHHSSPVDLMISCNQKPRTTHSLSFQKPDARMLGAWANEIDTTENGAYGVCLAALEVEKDLIAVRRAETQTGADWYVAPVGADAHDLESCFRLEVSGVDAGNETIVNARLKQKLEQARKGNSNLPAIASVVGFKESLVLIQKLENDK